MRPRARAVGVATAIVTLAVVFPPPAHGQRVNGGAFTIDSILTALEKGDVALNLASVDPAQHRALDSLVSVFQALRAGNLTVDDLAKAVSAQSAGWLDVLRWDRDRSARASQPALSKAFVGLQELTMPKNVGLGARIATLGPAAQHEYFGAMDTLEARVLQYANAASTAKLRRYEIKFGPDAPRLNPLETVLNYGLERAPWIGVHLGFGPASAGPGPLEVVTSYSSSELTVDTTSHHPRLMSAALFGLRYYTFDTTSGRGTMAKLVRPATRAVGFGLFSPTDHPLDSPLRAGRRYGGFVDYGLLRIAMALGHDRRAMLGASAQLIPHLF